MRNSESYFYFFSYGSNLLLDRIKKRCSSVEIIQPYQMANYRLIFNKVSKDKSTKANILKTENPNDFVWGLIQRMDISEKPGLDQAEGLSYGYDLDFFQVPGLDQKIHFYIATQSNYLKDGNPYDWYLDYVIYGAIENNFPREVCKYDSKYRIRY